MKILVTGGCGQLGMCLRRVMPDALFSDIVEAPGTLRLDITDLQAVRELVAREGIDTVVNCAGYTNVEKAEEEPELAGLLNAKAVENLAVAMKEVDGLLLHVSTDYVFGSKYNTPIPEEAAPAPESAYGRSKLHGEEALARVGCRHVIVRTAWLYSEFGKNFVKTMLQLTAERPGLKVVFDQVGTPTYAGDLADAILRLLKMDAPAGIYHFTNEGVCSWYDFAQLIGRYGGRTCDIRPCHSGEFPSKVKRPAYSVLDKSKIKQTLGLRIPHWTESLQLCINHLNKH